VDEVGLVPRVTDSLDRRALRVKLTASGERLFKRMAAEHERWVIDLFDGIAPRRKTQLAQLLQDLKRQVRAKTGP
jgi:DNA-binding MarR family transcriptional regulator